MCKAWNNLPGFFGSEMNVDDAKITWKRLNTIHKQHSVQLCSINNKSVNVYRVIVTAIVVDTYSLYKCACIFIFNIWLKSDDTKWRLEIFIWWLNKHLSYRTWQTHKCIFYSSRRESTFFALCVKKNKLSRS